MEGAPEQLGENQEMACKPTKEAAPTWRAKHVPARQRLDLLGRRETSFPADPEQEETAATNTEH